MKLSNPSSRYKLKIPGSYKVLDVGSGHNPHPRANVIIDKFTDSNYHRSGNIKVLKKQKFVEADGERMPFSDKEFDYVICCHVIEHVDDPEKFIGELCRVGKGGYLEAPSLIGEHLIPKESHRWVLLELNNKLIILDKKRLGLLSSHDFGNLFQDYLPKTSIGFKILQRTHPQVFTVNYEWKDSIDFIIEPSDEELRKFFTIKWDMDMYEKTIPKRSLVGEYFATLNATTDIFKAVFKSKILKRN